jgi:hypothetical protein
LSTTIWVAISQAEAIGRIRRYYFAACKLPLIVSDDINAAKSPENLHESQFVNTSKTFTVI